MNELLDALQRIRDDVVATAFCDLSTAEERAITHDKYVDGLQNAIRARTPEDICFFSWKLKSLVVFATDNSFYTKERVDTTINLLNRAAEATKGTSVEKHCAWRPKEFEKRLKLGAAVHVLLSTLPI